jgi:excisionase family DNA binding protein
MAEVWLTVSKAARYLGISEPTLRKWTDEGLILAWRTPGGHRRYHLESLQSFCNAQLEQPQEAEEAPKTGRRE